MARLYTRGGDRGTTRLVGGTEVSKADRRVAAYGAIDELNAVVGVAISAGPDAGIVADLSRAQSLLFELGSDLATPDAARERLGDADVAWLEGRIDAATAESTSLRAFILPGGTPAAAQLHVARTVCRRAEREIVALAAEATVGPIALRFANRFSDFLFVLARLENHRKGVREPKWAARKSDE